MEVKIHIANLDKFYDAVRRGPRTIAQHLDRAVQEAGQVFAGATKENIRTGLDMWKPPIDTGYMWNHIFTNIFPLKAEITATADYAIYVHEGTTSMQARPFFAITAHHEEGNISKIFERELDKAMQEIARG